MAKQTLHFLQNNKSPLTHADIHVFFKMDMKDVALDNLVNNVLI